MPTVISSYFSQFLIKFLERRESAIAEHQKAMFAMASTAVQTSAPFPLLFAQRGIHSRAASSMEKLARRTVKVTKEHGDDCKRLLTLMGVPYIDVNMLTFR